MSEVLHINGIEYIRAHDAAKFFGYTGDYVSRLAREKKIVATRVGRQWFVGPKSLELFGKISTEKKEIDNATLSKKRKVEHSRYLKQKFVPSQNKFDVKLIRSGIPSAVIGSAFMMLMGIWIVVFGFNGSNVITALPSAAPSFEKLVTGVYDFALTDSMQWASAPSSVDSDEEQTQTEYTNNEIIPAFDSSSGVIVLEGDISEETIESIRETFSDEVKISINEKYGDTGVITPVFSERDGEIYQFLMVPVDGP